MLSMEEVALDLRRNAYGPQEAEERSEHIVCCWFDDQDEVALQTALEHVLHPETPRRNRQQMLADFCDFDVSLPEAVRPQIETLLLASTGIDFFYAADVLNGCFEGGRERLLALEGQMDEGQRGRLRVLLDEEPERG